jgi:magnesium transporter
MRGADRDRRHLRHEFMRELKWSYGYFLVIGVIVAVCGTLYWRFRRNGWL